MVLNWCNSERIERRLFWRLCRRQYRRCNSERIESYSWHRVREGIAGRSDATQKELKGRRAGSPSHPRPSYFSDATQKELKVDKNKPLGGDWRKFIDATQKELKENSLIYWRDGESIDATQKELKVFLHETVPGGVHGSEDATQKELKDNCSRTSAWWRATMQLRKNWKKR